MLLHNGTVYIKFQFTRNIIYSTIEEELEVNFDKLQTSAETRITLM